MKRTLLIVTTWLCLVLCCIHTAAQSITTLDWTEMHIDSLLPHYSEVVPLPKDYADYRFEVRADYATWQPLNTAEELEMLRWKHHVASTLQINASVGTERGNGMLDIDFIPIICDSTTHTYKKLVQCKLTIKPIRLATPQRRSQAKATERYAANSVLASGKWVKIAVERDGMHALTPALLKEMGFANTSRVRLFGYGGHLLDEVVTADSHRDDLEEVPLVKGSNGQLLFWANGVQHWPQTSRNTSDPIHRTNVYSTRGYYFVTEGTPATIATEPSSTGGTATELHSFTAHALRDVDEWSFAQRGRYMWEAANIADGRQHTYTLSTPHPANSSARIRIAAASLYVNTIMTSVDGKSIGNIAISDPDKYAAASSVTLDKYITLAKNTTTIGLSTTGHAETHLDFIEVIYQRLFKMSSNEMPFYLPQNGRVRFSIEPESSKQNLRLMRIGTQNRPATLIAPDTGYTFTIENDNSQYVAFNLNATYPTPTICGVVKNQNLHAHGTTGMVIITPSSGIFDAEAERLVKAHTKYDGLECRIVRADQIYNEFSSGTPDATAYRLYLKMLYDRAKAEGNEPPRYLLLFGDCAYDNRMLGNAWRNTSTNDFLLCFESYNSLSDTQGYVMEDYFGLLEDGKGTNLNTSKMDIAIGRFPVRNQAEAKTAVDKTIAHLRGDDTGAWRNVVYVLGDDGDDNSHMKYADRVANLTLDKYPEIDTRKIMWDTYKRKSSATGNTYPDLNADIERFMREGAILFDYVGHGSTYLLSHENAVRLSTMKDFKNTRKALWYTAACDIMPFDTQTDNLGETMFLNPHGGATVFIGTARTVYASYNYTLNRHFVNYLFGTDSKGRPISAGEALRIAKNNVTINEPNKLQYALAGDPSLVFGSTTQKIVVDMINGQPATNSNPTQLKAGDVAHFTAHIERADGSVDSDFNGMFTARINDGEERVTCRNQALADTAFYFFEHRKLLFEHTDSVRNGKIDFSFIVPLDINYSYQRGRAVLAAYNKNAYANGACENYIVGGTSAAYDDTTGPTITMWLNSQTFEEGATVGPSPTLFAEIEDDCGLNFAAAGIGHGLEVCVDGRADQTYDISSTYKSHSGSTRSGYATFQLPIMSEGQHTVTLRAYDVYNNQSEKTIGFNVTGIDDHEPASLFVGSCSNSLLVVTLVTRVVGLALDVALHIYDSNGQLCHTVRANNIDAGEAHQFNIALNGSSGPASPGIYYLRADVKQGGNSFQTNTIKLPIRF